MAKGCVASARVSGTSSELARAPKQSSRVGGKGGGDPCVWMCVWMCVCVVCV
jgi:hypothetical protein